MGIEAVDSTDGAMLLEGLARALQLLPSSGLNEDQKDTKADLIQSAQKLAHVVWPSPEGQTFEDGARYSADEYRDLILAAILPIDEVMNLIT